MALGEMGSSDSSGGKFKFPECWNDDVRMTALFAPFRPKASNPASWDNKMKFWTNLIESWCKHHKSPVVEITHLQENFRRKGLIPACLENVLQNMSSQGIVVAKDNFMSLNETWTNWAVKALVTNPLRWTYNTVTSTLFRQNNRKTVYFIHMVAVQFLADELLNSIPFSQHGRVMEFEDLKQFQIKNTEDLYIVLLWLQKQGKVVVTQLDGVTLVKINKNGIKQKEFTETEMNIYKLECEKRLLNETIKKMETERNKALEETKKHIAAKMKSLAKLTLRKKQNLEKKIEKLTILVQNIESILEKIDEAKTNKQVIDCYEKGIVTLKRVMEEAQLDRDALETMEELKDVLNSWTDVESTLSQPLDSSLDEDLEDELNSLLLQDAPDVPSAPVEVKKSKVEKSEDVEKLKSKMEALSI